MGAWREKALQPASRIMCMGSREREGYQEKLGEWFVHFSERPRESNEVSLGPDKNGRRGEKRSPP